MTETKTKTKTKTTKSVYTKLINVRQKINESNIKKSGINSQLEFLYLELKDITPVATKLFQEEGITPILNFNENEVVLTIINNDDKEDFIEFKLPFIKIEPIISNQGRKVTNELQALGSTITYYRRYMYLIALDIAVPDEVEPQLGKEETVVENKAPKSPIERKEIVEKLTEKQSDVSEEELQGLRDKLVVVAQNTKQKYQNVMLEISSVTDGFSQCGREDFDKFNKLVDEIIEKEGL